MARSKRSEETVERLLQCQRWGVGDAGTADICAVDLTTVSRFHGVAAQRATTPHQQVVQDVDVPGVQVDEAHATLRPKQVAWVQTALAMGSWLLLGVDVGPRTQEHAAGLIAQVVARTRKLPLWRSEGWKPSTAALLQVVGVGYRPRHHGRIGLVVSLSHVVMPHTSLRQGRTLRIPALAIGLTDHVWSSREYIWLPVHEDPALKQQMEERIAHLLTLALQSLPRGSPQAKSSPQKTTGEEPGKPRLKAA
jgi:hypothetical protein